MSLASAQGLIGTAIGVAALGLALGFVVKAARGELFDGRDRRGRRRRRDDNIGFNFGGNMGGRRPKSRRSSGRSSQNIFDLGSTQRSGGRTRKQSRSGSDFNIFAV